MGVKVRVMVLVSLVALIGLSLTVPAADAAWGCSTGYNSNGWVWGQCSNAEPGAGGDSYRVNHNCRNIFTSATRLAHGTIVTVGSGTPSVITGCGVWYEQYSGVPYIQTMWR